MRSLFRCNSCAGPATGATALSRPPARAACVAVFLLLGLLPARAEVSPQDGYTKDGAPQIHIELAPYLWLPASNAQVTLGNGATAAASAGVPSLSQLANVLTGAFMGVGVLRYGPWSGELNIDYVGASQNKGLPPDVLGRPRSLTIDVSTVRVAPGIGYQVFNGFVGGIPATLDGRVGFAWFSASSTLDLDRIGLLGRERVIGISQSGDFTQPWLGLRGAIYPSPRWRFMLEAQGQGFGVSGGSWGWQVSAIGTWAATSWLNLNAGFMALHESGNLDASRAVKAFNATLYGPVLSVSFTF
ncbi:hypothetical protein [Rhodopila globiformis]|uniref:Uncharacterized protein n=1 Tax=Rhodopila globiformis TaxID=1071 RepID=A0A2S6MZT3_RHOGL|nr:hypothetical protein [Rhodopila globiformis]PPQ27860.1 hypothetical protein CCS01_25965 [Rhodopila globiformis]